MAPRAREIEIPDRLLKKYHEGKISQKQLAFTLGETEYQVHKYLTKHGLSLSHEEARDLRRPDTTARDAKIRALREQGLTVMEVGERVGVHYSQVSRIAGSTLEEKRQRAERVKTLRQQGHTPAEIATTVGLTLQRVRQILRNKSTDPFVL